MSSAYWSRLLFSFWESLCSFIFSFGDRSKSWAMLFMLISYFIFYEEKPAGAVVFAYVIDGWDFPFLAEGVYRCRLHFMIVLKVFFVKVNTF